MPKKTESPSGDITGGRFKGPGNGWALAGIRKLNPSFSGERATFEMIERCAKVGHFRPYYRFASQQVHVQLLTVLLMHKPTLDRFIGIKVLDSLVEEADEAFAAAQAQLEAEECSSPRPDCAEEPEDEKAD